MVHPLGSDGDEDDLLGLSTRPVSDKLDPKKQRKDSDSPKAPSSGPAFHSDAGTDDERHEALRAPALAAPANALLQCGMTPQDFQPLPSLNRRDLSKNGSCSQTSPITAFLQGEPPTRDAESGGDAEPVQCGMQLSAALLEGGGALTTGEGPVVTAAGDDVPRLMYEGKNYWPPNISLLALKQRAEVLMNAECVKLTPWTLGLYHILVLIDLRSGEKIVARITAGIEEDFHLTNPFYPSFKEGSEIATMRYIREHTTVPVPEIYAADEDRDGLVGGPFTLQEYVRGDNLDELWPTLSDAAKIHAIEQIAAFALQLFHLNFQMIGSLQATFTECEKRWKYSVGPMVTRRGLPSTAVVGPPVDPGPWNNARDWLISRARGGMDYQHKNPEKADEEYLHRIFDIINESPTSNGLPTEGDLAVCGLYHPDFGLHQIIARQSDDPCKVDLVAFVDWEAAQVIPRWALGQALRIKAESLSDALLAHCHAVMLKDSLYRKAHVEGLQARELSFLAAGASIPEPTDEWIQSFREGDWGDTGTVGA